MGEGDAKGNRAKPRRVLRPDAGFEVLGEELVGELDLALHVGFDLGLVCEMALSIGASV